ncbi:hypothetical protein J0H58_04665 [bacterium]|nr:hypothetical protein [bacterium]
MPKRLAVLAFLGGLLAVLVPSTNAQQPEPKGYPAFPGRVETPQVRKHYPLRHADPASTAKLLETHFGRTGVVSPTSRGVLVTSSSKGDEVAQLIEEIDQPQRQVAVVVTLAEVPSKDQLAELKGAPDQVLARLEEMSKAGQASLKRVTLTGVEGQPVTTTSGGDRPLVSSRMTIPGGFGGKGGQPQPIEQRSVNYRPLSTTVKMTARVHADGAVAVDLGVKDTSSKPPGEDGYPSVDMVDLTTRVTVPPGKAVLAQAVEEKDKAARTTVIVVTARVDASAR